MNRNKHIISLIAVLVFLFAAYASAPSVKSLTAENGKIPPDFKGYDKTLLIEKHSKDYNNYATRYFSQNYTGKVLLVDTRMMSAYDDLEEYRFIITRNTTSQTRYNPSAKPHENSHTTTNTTSYYITDRQTRKEYTIATSPAYGKVLKALSTALEKERKK